MSVIISGYGFEGPFEDASSLRIESGVYCILAQKFSEVYDVTSSNGNKYDIIDVGESVSVWTRVRYHDRKDCWKGNSFTHYVVHYCSDDKRGQVADKIRGQYDPPCGEE